MAIKLRIGGTYKVRDPEYCLKNDLPIQDTIIRVDETGERDFIGESGNGYFRGGYLYGEMQKWEDDLIEEIL